MLAVPLSPLVPPRGARARSGERSSEDRRRQCLEVGLAGQLGIDVPEPLGGLEQQWHRYAATRRDERDLCPQQAGLGALWLGQHPRLSRCDQAQSVIQRASLQRCAGRRERAPRPTRLLGCQRGGSLQEPSRCREPASCLGPCRRTFELGGNVLIGHGCRPSAVPGSAIRVDLRIGCVCQRPVNLAPLVRTGGAVHRRAHKWMTERHGIVQREQTFPLHRVRGRLWDAQLHDGAPQQSGVTERFCGRQQQQSSRVAREPRQPSREALLDPGGQRHRFRQAEAAGELGRGQPAGELQQGQWVPARLHDDPLQHALIQPPRQHRVEQRPCITVAERLDVKLSQTRKRIDRLPRREDHRDPLGEDAAGDEREHACRCPVEPLCVVDDAEQRLFRRDLRQQIEDREPHQEGIRTSSRAQPQRDFDRVSLGIRKVLQEVEARGAQLLKRRVGEFHLTLDADGAGDSEVRGGLDRVLDQRGLANTGVTVHDENGAVAVPRRTQQPVQHGPLALPAEQSLWLCSDGHPGSMPPG